MEADQRMDKNFRSQSQSVECWNYYQKEKTKHMSLSLMAIIRDDPDFGKRIQKKVQEIKQDKENLLNLADDYGKRYQQEIIEGTELRNRLLTEGTQRGLSEEQIMGSYGRFVPTVYTPILNLLYFLLMESADDPYYGDQRYQKREKLDEQFGHLREEEIKSEVLKEPPKMEEFLYGNLTLEQFDVLKKLKALAQSPNINEATQAFRKCKELCAKYELDYERIPCYVKKRKK